MQLILCLLLATAHAQGFDPGRGTGPIGIGIDTDPGLLPLPKPLGDFRIYKQKQYDWVKRAKRKVPPNDKRGKEFRVWVASVTATAERAERNQRNRWQVVGKRLFGTEPRDLDGETLRRRAESAFQVRMAHIWGYLVPKVFEEELVEPEDRKPYPVPPPEFFVKEEEYLAWKPITDQLLSLLCEADPTQCEPGTGAPLPERPVLEFPSIGHGVPRHIE